MTTTGTASDSLRISGRGKCLRRGALAALFAMQLAGAAIPAPAAAMQLLEAVDHAELSAEISASEVNRIALIGDRVLRVVRAPDGYAVEHDAVSGDLWLRRMGTRGGHPGMGADAATLFIGTEKGFTYRLTLMPSDRDAAQILIRNAAAMPGIAAGVGDMAGTAGAGDPRIGVRGRPHIAALVKLVRAVARREPLAGYSIHAGGGLSVAGLSMVETWRGPRFHALVLEAWPPGSEAGAGSPRSGPDLLPSAGGALDAAGLAGTIGALPGVGRVQALWLAAPGSGPKGGRLAVAVVESVRTETAR